VTRKQIRNLFLAGWLGGTALIALFVGSFGRNESFEPQSEFELDTWFALPGPLDFNKGVMYVLLAAVITVGLLLYVANRMQQRPNKVQTAVEAIYALMRDQITRGSMDDKMARKWFPVIGTIFLFILVSNLIGYMPLPTNTHETIHVFGAEIPALALYAATANVSVPLVLALLVFIAYNLEGLRAKGFVGYMKSFIPQGISGVAAVPMFTLEFLSNFMRLISLTVRLFANLLAGHLIILFMSGGLVVILGTPAIGWFLLPFGIVLFLFELVLVAGLQAFIFATLTSIYLGGAVSESH
jgi:F-type H+-transporting ATPase subunit a